jgi:hypothetical protein
VGALVLAWPAVSATGLPAQTSEGTLVVSASGSVTASAGTVLTFTFTGPVPSTTSAPPTFKAIVPTITVTVSMPQGWTAGTPSDLTCTPPDCSQGGSTGAGFGVTLYPGVNSFTIEVQATPPGDAGPATFTATEVSQGTTLTQVTSSPLNVICPADGLGTMVVDPTTAAVASRGTFTFTYTAGSCGASPSGSVGVTVPSGWTARGPVGAPADNLVSGSPVTFTYGPAQASSTGPATFAAWQVAAGGPPQYLASPPVVVVTPSVAPSSPSSSPPSSTPPSSTPPTTVSPTSAPPTSGPPTSAPPTSAPPTRTVSGKPGSRLPIALVASGASAGGLALLAGGLLAARSGRRGARLRRGGHGAGGGDIRAVPHTGPPPSVAVRDTGTTPTLTVRLLPYAGATSTTIKEQRP